MRFTVKDHATCSFEGSEEQLLILNLELQYAATLRGEGSVNIVTTNAQINEGAVFDLTGGGHAAMQGPGAGQDGASQGVPPSGAGFGGDGGEYSTAHT